MRALASVAMVSAICAWNCGPSSGGADGSNGGTSPAPGAGGGGGAQVALAMTVSGRGTIRATSPAFECTAASCTRSLQKGGQIHLTAVPSEGAVFDGWTGACAGTAACDLLLDGDKSVGASFRTLPGPPGQLSVDVQVNGQGDVRSDPSGIDCGATCQATFAAGVSPRLVPAARAGFRFDGWGGACTGAGDCRLQAGDASVSLTVFATFVPVAPLRHVLTVSITGSGKVTSGPPGIDCGATCSASFDEGTSVALSATPGASGRLTSWGGACSGSGACTVVLGGDIQVSATFAQVTSAECDGIVPASLGTAVTATAPAGFCEDATSDGSGAVAIDSAGNWFTFSSSGASLGKIPALTLVPLDSGFAGVTSADADIPVALWNYHMWAADGSSTFKSAVGNDACFSPAYPSSTGGAVVVANCGNTVAGDSAVIRFDASGNRTFDRRAALGIYFAFPALRGDANGNTVAVSFGGTEVGLGATDLVARWVDGKGALLTNWFTVSSGGTVSYSLASAIGGGAFVQQDGVWRAFLPSGSAGAQAAPAWLASRTGQNLSIVRGRRAYALTSRTGGSTVELFAPSGTRCGSIDVGGGNVSIGADGTVFTQTTANTCRRDFFPGLLK